MPIIAVVATDDKQGRAIILGFSKLDIKKMQERQVCTKDVSKYVGSGENVTMILMAADSEAELIKRFEEGTGVRAMPMSTENLSESEISGLIKSEKN